MVCILGTIRDGLWKWATTKQKHGKTSGSTLLRGKGVACCSLGFRLQSRAEGRKYSWKKILNKETRKPVISWCCDCMHWTRKQFSKSNFLQLVGVYTIAGISRKLEIVRFLTRSSISILFAPSGSKSFLSGPFRMPVTRSFKGVFLSTWLNAFSPNFTRNKRTPESSLWRTWQ